MTQTGHAPSLDIRSRLRQKSFVEEWVPTYQYRCEKCGKTVERIESMAEEESVCGSK